MDFIKDFTITKEEGSQVKIEGEIPFAELQKEREKAIKHLGKNIEIDGFRKGHVPENVLVEKIGEINILTEMAERALARVYPEILKAHEIDAIGHPQIQITKIAPDNPLGFTATLPTMPAITLPDYKQIATDANKDKASAEVTDEEVEKQAEDIIRQKVAYEKLQSKAQSEKPKEDNGADMGDTTELPTPETVSQSGGLAQEVASHEGGDNLNSSGTEENKEEEGAKAIDDSSPNASSEEALPELTDEYVKTLGQPGQFESVEDFKTKLREHLAIEKEREVSAAHRAKITDKIIEDSTMELPQIMIDSEIGQMFAQMEEDLKRANLKMDDYLEHIKKTKEDLQKEWGPAAEKRAKLQLILNEIAKKEGTEPDKAQLETQVEQLMEQYKDADEARVRVYVESVMTNEAVMQLLEKL